MKSCLKFYWYILAAAVVLVAQSAVAQPNRNISLVSEALVTGSYQDVEVVGDRLWCANEYGVVVFDLANWDPATMPTEIAHFPTDGKACGLFVQDTLCYVADGPAGLKIFDISDLNAVELLGQDDGSWRVGVTVKDGVAYVLEPRGSRQPGIFSIEVSDSRRPRHLGYLELTCEFQTMILRDTLLWVSARRPGGGQSYATAINVADPRNMEITGGYTSTWTMGFSINDDVAFIGTGNLYSLDIRNPRSIEVLDSLTGHPTMADLCVNGRLYGDHGFFAIADVSDPRDLHFLGALVSDHGELVNDNVIGPKPMTIFRDHLIAGAFQCGLKIVDVSDPRQPRVEHFNERTGVPVDVVYQGNHLYVADGLSGSSNFTRSYYDSGRFRVYSVTDIHNPRPIFIMDSVYVDRLGGQHFQRVVVRDTLAFLGIGDNYRLSILDISDPEHPETIYPFSDNGAQYLPEGRFYGNFLIEPHSRWLRISDISDPRNPRMLSFTDLCNNSSGLIGAVITDSLLYTPVNLNQVAVEMRVYNWSDPQNVRQVGQTCELPYFVGWGEQRGDYTYWIRGDTQRPGFVVVSIADPLQPVVVYATDEIWYGEDLKIFGDKVFIADGYDGVKVYSLEDPERPELVGSYDTPGYAYALDVNPEQGFMAVADRSDLTIYDVGQLIGAWSVSLMDTIHDFGQVWVDSTVEWTLELTNNTDHTLQIDSLKVEGEGFSLGDTSAFEIGAGGVGAVAVYFTPDSSKL